MKASTKSALRAAGEILARYFPPAILWGIGFGFLLQALQNIATIVFYSSRTASEWIAYTDPLYGPVTQGYVVQNAAVSVPLVFLYSILFLYFAYRLTPKPT